MTSNPKPIVTIVLPERRGPIIMRPARVFVGDVELPVKSVDVDVDVDLDNGDVDLTLSTQEVRIVREAPAPAAPEPAGPEEDVLVFKADPDSLVCETEFPDPMRRWDARLPRAHRTITFNEPIPGVDVATVTVSVPRPKRAGGARHSYNLGGAR